MLQVQVSKVLGFGSMGVVYFGVLWDAKVSAWEKAWQLLHTSLILSAWLAWSAEGSICCMKVEQQQLNKWWKGGLLVIGWE